ncbi:MAG TPA: site-2 protease family protein, partial [Actinomycetota bacterium]|nr:site-2 protease family protein [Actinomycetota bacterium]
LAALLFFVSILAHELAHALVARKKGIKVETITLFIFGGIAHIKKDPEKPGDEFQIAIAGPVLSLVFGAIFFGIGLLAEKMQTMPAAAIFQLLGVVNGGLAVFNMAPGFPLDGGRVLRAAVWKATGNILKATRVASIGGRIVAMALIGGGLYRIFFNGDLFGVWWILIGWFLNQAAAGSYNQLLMRQTLQDMTVADVMSPAPSSIPGNLRIHEAVDNFFVKMHHSAYPVIGYGDHLEGLLTLHQIRSLAREQWDALTVRQVMFPIQPAMVTSEDEPVGKVFERITENPAGKFLVMKEGALIGMLSVSDVARVLRADGAAP